MPTPIALTYNGYVAQWEGSVDSHLSLLAGPATVTPDLPWAAGATINTGAAPSAPTA